IADEYFARSAKNNFVDMDVLVVGAVVPQLAAIFDAYWNSRQAYPVDIVLGELPDANEARKNFDHLVDDGEQMMSVTVPPEDMLGRTRSDEISTRDVSVLFGGPPLRSPTNRKK